MKTEAFIKLIDAHIYFKYKTKLAAAEALGVSAQYVGQMINGKRPPSSAMLKEMGYTKHVGETTYHKEVK